MEKDFECTSKLIGKNLNGKWKVVEKMEKEPIDAEVKPVEK